MKKFALKALVAAVAFAGASSQAFADIQPGNLTSGATGGELVFYAFDDVTKTVSLISVDSVLGISSKVDLLKSERLLGLPCKRLA